MWSAATSVRLLLLTIGLTELLVTLSAVHVVVLSATSVSTHASVEVTVGALMLRRGSTTVVALHTAATTLALMTIALSIAIVVVVVLASGILVTVLVLHVLACERGLIWTDRVTRLAQLSFTVSEVAALTEQAVSVLLVMAAPLRLVVHVHLFALRVVEVRSTLVVVATVRVVLTSHVVMLLLLTAHAHLVVVLLGHHHLVGEAHLLMVVALPKLVRRLHLHLLRHHHVRKLRWRHAILTLRHILHQQVHEHFVGRLLLRG